MREEWIVFESFISFLEMLTSCFLATRIFRKEIKGKKDILIFILFAISGAALLTLREIGILPIPDYIPALVIFGLYAIFICHGKLWSAVLWSLLNYLLIGIVALSVSAWVSIMSDTSLSIVDMYADRKIISRVLTRIGQLLVVEIISHILKRRQKTLFTHKKEMSLIGVSILSILALMLLWNTGDYLTKENVSYFNILVCLLILLLNFILLFLKDILSREQFQNQELKAQNRIINMQIRNQNEVNEMYHSMRALRHDMNNHFHTILGYMQLGEYKKAEEYLHRIAGEVDNVETYQSGNSAIDALIGSKTTLAKKNEIPVTIEMSVPSDLKISMEHLTVVIGSLYDNAIDANMRIANVKEFLCCFQWHEYIARIIFIHPHKE